MSDSNLSLFVHGKNDIRLAESPTPEPGPGQVQVAIKHVGICGTDLHIVGGGCGFWVPGGHPFVVGHEAAGVVSKLGPGVTNLKVGDKVAIEPMRSCQQCDLCKSGRYNICEGLALYGSPAQHGAVCRYQVFGSAICHKLPDSMSTEDGALVEPLTIGIHACKRGGVTVGSRVLVSGAGPIGLLAMLAAKAFGATFIGIIDRSQQRLDVAKKLGANVTVQVTSDDPKVMSDKIIQAMREKPKITIECRGTPPSVQTSILVTVSGGCVVLTGMGPTDMSIPIFDAISREIDIMGSNCSNNCYPATIALIESGRINVTGLASHVFDLKDALKAYEEARKRVGLKVLIKCGKD